MSIESLRGFKITNLYTAGNFDKVLPFSFFWSNDTHKESQEGLKSVISTHGRSSFPLNYQHIQHIITYICNIYVPLFVWALTFGSLKGFELTTLCARSKSSSHVSCPAYAVLTLFFRFWLAAFGQVTSKKGLLHSQWTWHLHNQAFRLPKKSPLTPKAMLDVQMVMSVS